VIRSYPRTKATDAANQLLLRDYDQDVLARGPSSIPHFHAYYGEHEASLDLAGAIIAGFLPKRVLRLVRDWTELHTDELTADWERAVNRELLEPIAAPDLE
jgi:hypothetical protein